MIFQAGKYEETIYFFYDVAGLCFCSSLSKWGSAGATVFSALFEVVLMVVFRRIKGFGRNDFRDYRGGKGFVSF